MHPLLNLLRCLSVPALLACAAPAAAAVQDPAPTEAQLEALQKKVDEILPRVAQLRGLPFKHQVQAGIHTPDQFIEFAKQDMEDEMPVEQLRAMGQALGLFGLVDANADLFDTFMELLRGQVGGYYDPKSKKFYMISTFNQGMMADIIMAHELTHALDDQYYDLDALIKSVGDNSDRQFAVRAVVEGSGTSLMNLYTVKGALEKWFAMTAEDTEAMNAMMEDQMAQLENAPPFLIVTLALPYLEGNKFLVRNDNMLAAISVTPTAEDLNRAFANPPASSEQVLHFEKYWDPEHFDEPTTVELPDRAAALGGGWSLAYSDSLGELGAYFLVIEEMPDLMSIFTGGAGLIDPASSGWDGDTYHLYRGPNGALAMVWASVWDSAEDASEFAGALVAHGQARTPTLKRVEDAGNRVLAYFSNTAGAEALEVLRQQPQ